MGTEIEKAVGALKMALRVEQNGYRFYQRAAGETDIPEAEALFRGLAEDEMAHESIIRTRLRALERDGEWKPVSASEWPVEAEAAADAIFSPGRVGEGISDYTSELSALRMAYLIEKNAGAFYKKAAREAEDPTAKAMYEDLAEWERGHQEVLEKEYRFLADRFKLDVGFAPF
jgi:rubrerythrin